MNIFALHALIGSENHFTGSSTSEKVHSFPLPAINILSHQLENSLKANDRFSVDFKKLAKNIEDQKFDSYDSASAYILSQTLSPETLTVIVLFTSVISLINMLLFIYILYVVRDQLVCRQLLPQRGGGDDALEPDQQAGEPANLGEHFA